MQRGNIYIADLDSARPSEATKRRPGVIVSADSLNRTVDRLGAGAVAVVLLSSNVSRVYDFQVLPPAAATGLNEDSKAQAEPIRALSFASTPGCGCTPPSDGRRPSAVSITPAF